MILVLLAGAAAGGGVALLIRGLFPPPPPLAAAMAALHHPATPGTAPAAIVSSERGGWAARAGMPLAALLAALGLPTAAVRRDLAVLGRPIERHLAEKATAALVGLGLIPTTVLLLALAGLHVPGVVPVWASLGLGAAGFIVPDLIVRAQAAARRAEMRHALGAFLDLVVVALAGGTGVDAALDDAATVGGGWACAQIRRALDTARLSRRPPAESLGQLGDELGVPALTDLAASMALAGTEGAKVRHSLAAKAAALRAHELTDAEGAAHAATERMSLPVVGLFTSFLIFIGYPALTHVLTSL